MRLCGGGTGGCSRRTFGSEKNTELSHYTSRYAKRKNQGQTKNWRKIREEMREQRVIPRSEEGNHSNTQANVNLHK